MSELRIPQIIEKQIQGHTKTEIARDLGVSRKTITRDTQTDHYLLIVDGLIKKYIDNLDKFMDSDQATISLEGTKEFGRIIRTGFTRQTKHTEDINIKATIDITEQRKKADALIKKMELSPDQFKVWEEHAVSENLDK